MTGIEAKVQEAEAKKATKVVIKTIRAGKVVDVNTTKPPADAARLLKTFNGFKILDEERDLVQDDQLQAGIYELFEQESEGSKRAAPEDFQNRKIRRKVEKTFATGGAVDPSRNYHVPLPSAKLEDSLKNGKYCLILAHRQAGKSTLAITTQAAIQNCYYIYLRTFQGIDIWHFLHWKLNGCDGAKFPMPQAPTAQSLQRMLEETDGPIAIVMDEANTLAKIPNADLMVLLQMLRSLKHGAHDGKGVMSVVLIGTDDLSQLVRENDKLISPFSQEDRISPRKLERPCIQNLLEQWEDDHKEESSLGSPLEEFAEEIASLSNGHPGVAGVCCAQLARQSEKINEEENRPYSILDFQKFSCQGLLRHLDTSTSFSRLFSGFQGFCTASQRKLFHQIVIQREVPYNQDDADIRALLDLGYIVLRQKQNRGVSQEFVEVAAPLLATVLLSKHQLALPDEMDLPGDGFEKDTKVLGKWVVRSIAKYLDCEQLNKIEALLAREANGLHQTSEYNFQLQCAFIAQACYNKIAHIVKQDFKVVLEARADGDRKRLDVVIVNGMEIRMGQELLVAGTQENFNTHYNRAKCYASKHSCHIWTIDFRSCKGRPDDFRERLVLPSHTILTRAGSKVDCALVRIFPDVAQVSIQFGQGTDKEIFDLAKPLVQHSLS